MIRLTKEYINDIIQLVNESCKLGCDYSIKRLDEYKKDLIYKDK